MAELGAVWIKGIAHVPLLVSPVDFADLDGVQLGEQALRIDRSSDLVELRDRLIETMAVQVPTAQWNRQKELFLNRWDAEMREQVSGTSTVSGDDYRSALEQNRALERDLKDAREDLASHRAFFTDIGKKWSRVPRATQLPDA